MNTPVAPRTIYKSTGLDRIVKAGGYSVHGLRAAWTSEAAYRQECVLALTALAVILITDLSAIERILLVLATVLVLIVELRNSAIESVIDRIGLEHHVLSGQAKDMGSAAVALTLILWIYIWCEVLINA